MHCSWVNTIIQAACLCNVDCILAPRPVSNVLRTTFKILKYDSRWDVPGIFCYDISQVEELIIASFYFQCIHLTHQQMRLPINVRTGKAFHDLMLLILWSMGNVHVTFAQPVSNSLYLESS